MLFEKIGDMTMKKLISICLVFILAVGVLSSCGLLDTPDDKPTEELEFHLLDDGTYGVSAGDAVDFERIVIPSTHNDQPVTQIMDKAFFEAKNIKSITVPDSVTSIGESAFAECSGLTNLTIGNGVTFIGPAAFNNCHSLKYNEYENGFYLGNNTNPYVVLTFASVSLAEEITEFNINDATKIIHFAAFYGFNKLKSITIPNGVTCIGEDAFCGCDSLKSVTIPDSVTSVGRFAFDDCDALTNVKIGNGVTSINDFAFYECKSLESIELPEGITSIGDSAFCDCSNLKNIIFNGTEAEWNAIDKHILWDHDTNDYAVTYNGQ